MHAGNLGGMNALLITASPEIRDAVLRLSAAAGVAPDVCASPGAGLAAWSGAVVVLVGTDLADGMAALAPARRGALHVVGPAPGEAAFRAAVALGAESVIDLSSGAEWLGELLGEVGERAGPGRVIGVVGGSGGAGATTLACALGQWHSARGPTLLLDTDPLGPGLDRLLGLEEVDGARWESLADTAGRLGARALRDSVPRRGDLGVVTWSGLRRRLDLPTVRRILTAARRGHDLVVLDLARHGGADLVELADRCDELLVVSRASVPGLAATARLVAELGRGREGRAGLVLRPGGVGDADAERATGLPLVATIRHQRGLAEALDRGSGPLGSRGPLVRAVRDLLPEAA